MKLIDLYTRVVETTGLEIVTIPSLQTAVANCFADLTSRGYRTFNEINFTTVENLESNKGILTFSLPSDLRKTVYLRVYFNNKAIIATRYSLNNKRVASVYSDGCFRSVLQAGQAIFYIKGDKVYLEWDSRLGNPIDINFGYYQRLIAPHISADAQALTGLEDINIRAEFEDAVVFYSAYFYYSRFVKDTDKIQLYLANYKYYVEDITHELAYEDDFNEEDAVIACEDE